MKIYLLALTVLVAVSSFAQDDKKKTSGGNSLSIGAEVGLPMSSGFKQSFSVGFGGSAKAAFGIFDGGAVTLSAGYMTFGGKNGNTVKFNVIPVKAGLRYNLASGVYAEPQLGMSFTSFGGFSSSAFTYALGIGTIINNQIDIGVRYEAMSKTGTTSFLGARVAYNFGL